MFSIVASSGDNQSASQPGQIRKIIAFLLFVYIPLVSLAMFLNVSFDGQYNLKSKSMMAGVMTHEVLFQTHRLQPDPTTTALYWSVKECKNLPFQGSYQSALNSEIAHETLQTRLHLALRPIHRWGSLRRSPRSPSRLGEGAHPTPSPLDAFGVSTSPPLAA